MKRSLVVRALLPLVLLVNVVAFLNCSKNGDQGPPGGTGSPGSTGSPGATGAVGASGLVGQSVSNVSAHYINGAPQPIPPFSMTTVNFDLKDFDTSNAVTAGSSWGFAAPTSGLYAFSVSVRIGDGCHWTAATTTQLQLLANGTVVVADLDFQTGTISHTRPVTLRGSTTIRLAANDSVSAQISQDTGGTCTINTGIATSISIARIGD